MINKFCIYRSISLQGMKNNQSRLRDEKGRFIRDGKEITVEIPGETPFHVFLVGVSNTTKIKIIKPVMRSPKTPTKNHSLHEHLEELELFAKSVCK